MNKAAAVILAAGGSTRMGQPKQLLPWQGQSLLRRAVDAALGAGCHPVVVVLRPAAERLRLELSGIPVTLVENAEWELGPGTSVQAGVGAIGLADAVVFLVCDQPLVDAVHIHQLINAHQTTGLPMAASEYGGTVGVPALFGREYFAALMELTPATGAKQVLLRNRDLVVAVPFPAGERDIDTPADYERLIVG
jgi:molybdenum cofactor cytidylyltransferase